jgi:hypothetical protein
MHSLNLSLRGALATKQSLYKREIATLPEFTLSSSKGSLAMTFEKLIFLVREVGFAVLDDQI